MREIKFRGKRIDNGVWVYGNLIILPDKALIAVHTGNDNSLGEHTYKTYAVDPATVGQYVELKDKNGREIYEGDIIKWYNSDVLLISRCKRHARFLIGDDLLTKGAALDSIIIGNIHDNPELL